MKVQFRNNRLELQTEDNEEERFAGKLSRLIAGVSNDFMSWYGDVRFDDKETSGFVITYRPSPAEMEKIDLGTKDNEV
jgi:hypothetical protein